MYEEGKLLWKHIIESNYIFPADYILSGKEEDIFILLQLNYGGLDVEVFKKDIKTSFSTKTIRNITFQYPILAYVMEAKELWIQDLNNNVSIYYFDAKIAAMENINNIQNEKKSKISLGMVLDYGEFVQTSTMV